MAERKSLSKKTRFEVFKRDSFACQYCGAKAPDVILEVDHIKPVVEGGTNDMINLITSCFDCNRGKGKTKLKDNPILDKQRAQIEELNLRRQQLEMMLEWRNGLMSLDSEIAQAAIDNYNSKFTTISLTEVGEKKISNLVRKHGLQKVLDKTDEVFDKYYNANDEKSSSNIIFTKIGSFLTYDSFPEYKKRIAYLKGIIKNKSNYFNEKKTHIVLESIYKQYGVEAIEILIGKCKVESSFRSSDLEEKLNSLLS